VFPHEYHFGPILINGYGIMAIVGVALGLYIQRLTAPPAGLSVRDSRDLSFWMLISGLLGSRVFYVLLHWQRYRGRPFYEMADYLGGGLMFQGGLITAVLVALLILRARQASFLRFGDALAPALALGQGLGRVGCFLAGCCHGRVVPAGFPLGVTFPPGGEAPPGVALYPTELMESLGLLALSLFLYKREKSPTYVPGRVLGTYLVGSGLLRFVVDFFRGDDRGRAVLGLAPTAWLAILICVSGVVLLKMANSKKPAAITL
jgi:phosphatidylglycerol:prolipoprotein diacylglycerol transferase